MLGAERTAEALGRSTNSIRHHASILGLTKASWRWTEDEDDFLRKCYGAMTASEISEKLDRSVMSVRNRVHKLGLAKNKKRA